MRNAQHFFWLVALLSILLVAAAAKAGDLEGTLGNRTQLGQVAEGAADYELVVTEAACNRLAKQICYLHSRLKADEKARFRDLSLRLSGKFFTIEGIAEAIPNIPTPFSTLRFRIETVPEVTKPNQIDFVVKKIDLTKPDGSTSLAMKLFGTVVTELVMALKRHGKFKEFIEFEFSGFGPAAIPIVGGLFTRKILVKIKPKALPILDFIDTVQLSRDGGCFVVRGVCSRP